ncbi:MAG: hypothetical protein H6840_00195 [Planctomycetes bacterium]|nr:hypothetical protein [Planctomycetota bacterium]
MQALRTLCVALFLALTAAGLQATVALKLDLATLTDKSSLIVVGKVDSKEARWDAGRTGIWTHYGITVSETLKGAHEKSREVAIRGGVVGDVGQHVAGAGSLDVGAEYVLFLWKDDDGRYQLQGMAQGAFAVSEREGDKYAKNSVSGMTIVDPKTLKPSKDAAAKQPLEFKLAELKKQIADAQKPAVNEEKE